MGTDTDTGMATDTENTDTALRKYGYGKSGYTPSGNDADTDEKMTVETKMKARQCADAGCD